MSSAHALAWMGGFFEVVGLALTAYDLNHAAEALDPGRWKRRRHRVEGWVRRLLRRPRNVNVNVSAGDTISFGSDAIVTVHHEPPADDAPPEEWFRWMRLRTDAIEREHRDGTARTAKALQAARTELSGRIDTLSIDIEAQRAAERERETASIRIQGRGLLLIGIGAILSTASNLV